MAGHSLENQLIIIESLRHKVGAPKVLDFDKRSTPAQWLPRSVERGRPGVICPVASRACAPGADAQGTSCGRPVQLCADLSGHAPRGRDLRIGRNIELDFMRQLDDRFQMIAIFAQCVL